jgi:AraC-like DNA-binding protein
MKQTPSFAAPSLRQEWLRHTIDQCQIVAIAMGNPADCPGVARELLARTQPPRTAVEACVLRGMLAELMLRQAVESHCLSPDCVSILAHARELAPPMHRTHPAVARALALIRRLYRKSTLSLAEVASGAGVSPYHLSHLLQTTTGFGFLHHVRQHRLRRAQKLLVRPLSLKQIAFEVGYKRRPDLTRHFKNALGVTPTTWRRGRKAAL